MATRRFTDPKKWSDPWFMALSPIAKLVWLYVVDECDNAGVWNVNRRLAAIQIGWDIDWHAIELELGDRIVQIRDGSRWWVPAYIAFQCPRGFNPKVAAHLQIQRLLIEHGIDISLAGPGWDPRATPLAPPCHKEQEQERDSLSLSEKKTSDVSGDTRAREAPPIRFPASQIDPTDVTSERPPLPTIVAADGGYTAAQRHALDQLRFARARMGRDEHGTWLLAVKTYGLERVIEVVTKIRTAGDTPFWSTVGAWLEGDAATGRPNDGWHYPKSVRFDADGPHIIDDDGERVPFRPNKKLADMTREGGSRG